MPQAQQLGRYHLLDRIAFGGMAEIFRAKTFDSGGQAHLVAVKRVLAHLVEDQDFLQMLVDEAKISALLRHENIARLFEFARAGDEYFLAMEYVDGKDLRSLLERGRALGRPIPPEHVAWVAMETAHALHAAHTQRDGAGRALRIVHRDVSPSNVLCSYHGEVKLCDFGIAKATLTRVQTKTGVIKGKVKYMSPEQAMGRKLDHRSDLFSLGTVMYEMLTLQAPFQAPTEIELIFAVRDARKTAIREIVPEVPEEMCRLVDRVMTRSRAARFQSGEELALELRILLDKMVPGYRRSHFSRFMRKIFEEEIEKELRHLEAYEIAQADGTQVGENLIAEALGPDAPFTKFTPLYQGGNNELTNIGTSNFPHIEPAQPADLHGQPTMMLDRAALGLAPVEHPPETDRQQKVDPEAPSSVEVSEQAAPTDLHSEQTRILMTPAPVLEKKGSLHEQETGEKELPTQEGYRRLVSDGDPAKPNEPAPATPDPAKPATGDLHGAFTMILFNPMTESAATVPYRGEGGPTTPYDRAQAVASPAAPEPAGGDAPTVDATPVEDLPSSNTSPQATPTPEPTTEFGAASLTMPTDPRMPAVAPAPAPSEPEMPTTGAIETAHLLEDMSPPPDPPPHPKGEGFPPGSVEDFDDSPSTGEETSVPIHDEDLEPVG